MYIFNFHARVLIPRPRYQDDSSLAEKYPDGSMRALSLLLSLDLNYIYLLFFGWLGRLYKRREVINITVYDRVR